MTSVQHIDEPRAILTRIEGLLTIGRFGGIALLVGLFCFALIVYADKPIALYISQSIDRTSFQVWAAITKVGDAGPYFIFFILLFLAARAMFVRTAPMAIARWYAYLARTALFSLVSFAVAGLLVNLLKFCFGRGRPRHLFTEGSDVFSPMSSEWLFNSFPSGHAQVIFIMATLVAVVLPRLSFVAFFIAAMVALSRVMISVHYVSDIVFGAFIGIATVLWVRQCAYRDLETLSFDKYRAANPKR